MQADELSKLIERQIQEAKDRIDAYDERHAIQDDSPSNAVTTERALQALERPERFRGEHDVARAWLTHHAERIWTRI